MRPSTLAAIALLSLTACAPAPQEPSADAVDDQVPLSGTIVLEVSPIVTGNEVTFTASGVAPGARPWVVWGFQALVDGWCPPQTAPNCLDLRTPAGPVAQMNPANAAGVATLVVTAPPSPVSQIAFQAVQFAPFPNASTAITAPMILPGGDEDNDGLLNEDELPLFGTDPYDPDSDGGGMNDGDEIGLGLDPLAGADDPVVVGVASLVPGDLVITELHRTPGTTPAIRGTYVEVTNRTSDFVQLGGLTVRDSLGTLHTVAPLIVAPGDYVTFGHTGDPAFNGGYTPDQVLPGLDLSGTGLVQLRTSFQIDGVQPTLTWPSSTGASLQLSDDALDDDNAERAFWCASSASYGTGDLGTPGEPNGVCISDLDHAWFVNTIQTECTGCHTGGGSLGGVNFDTYAELFQASVDVPSTNLIVPGNPDLSYLYLKTVGDQATLAGGTGQRMPRGGPFFSQAVEDDLRDWIVLGAPQF